MYAESKGARIAGWVLTILISLFLLLDGVLHVLQPKPVIDATNRIGFPIHALTGIGSALIIAVVLYVVPMTAVLGAVLLTGYFGGAVATHVRAGSSAFETLFPAILGTIVWISLLLRERRLGELLPLRRGIAVETARLPSSVS